MRIPLKTAVGVPMAAVAAAGVVAFSASPASAVSHGRWVADKQVGGCLVELWVSHPKKNVYWAYASVRVYPGGPWTCQAYAKNTAGTKRWTPRTVHTAWSDGVWDGAGYKAWSCVYAYYNGNRPDSGCTSSH
jgi:hypothetical protein